MGQPDLREVHDWVYEGTARAGKLLFVYAIPKDGTTPEQLSQEIRSLGYATLTPKDAQDFINQVIGVLQAVVLAFGAITLVASFFGVVNTQYISVLERTREIGLMKALGMSRSGVSRLFVVEATWIGLLGAALGALLAIAAGTTLNPLLSEWLKFGDERLLIFNPLQVVGLIVFLMLVTTLAGLLPARKAAKLDPIEALRTE
jgi:putative ABC transport system permease protein